MSGCFDVSKEPENTSPMVMQMQKLEERIKKLEEMFEVDISDHDKRIDDLENIQAEPRLIYLEKKFLDD